MDENFMTFNLRFDNPEDGGNAWKNRSDKVAKTIKKYQPLVIGTQEGKIHMLKDLEKELPEYHWLGQGRYGDQKDEFNAIFYHHEKVECIDQGQFWLSEQPHILASISWNSSLPRICTWGHFKAKQSPYKQFILYNTHLDHMSEEAREQGIHLVWQKIKDHHLNKNIPIILTGDFNSEPNDLVIEFLRGREALNGETANLKYVYDILDGSPGTTIHNFNGGESGEPIDYIFCTEEVDITQAIIDRSAIDGVYPSDHYPVIAKLNF